MQSGQSANALILPRLGQEEQCKLKHPFLTWIMETLWSHA